MSVSRGTPEILARIANRSGDDQFAMMFASERFAGGAGDHSPASSKALTALTPELVLAKKLTHDAGRWLEDIAADRGGGHQPHAGEAWGMLGDDEARVLLPAIAQARDNLHASTDPLRPTPSSCAHAPASSMWCWRCITTRVDPREAARA